MPPQPAEKLHTVTRVLPAQDYEVLGVRLHIERAAHRAMASLLEAHERVNGRRLLDSPVGKWGIDRDISGPITWWRYTLQAVTIAPESLDSAQ